MIQRKICMLGSFAVGKTSLVSRFVQSIFSDKYLTTVGVKIDRKEVAVGERQLNLVLWDINGQDAFQTVQKSYLRGSAGYLLVVDGTRPATLDVAVDLNRKAEDIVGKVPFMLLLNKADLAPDWQIDQARLVRLANDGWKMFRTSAKTGAGVEEAFQALARHLSDD
jgi:small GTP-binding protein